MINSYPSIKQFGHPLVSNIFASGLVLIEEKVDGSQFSMMNDADGNLHCRSKGQMIDIDNPDKMFIEAVNTAKSLKERLNLGWTYRCEYLRKPKHNTICYSRVPLKTLALFDIEYGIQKFVAPGEKLVEALRLGIDCVPVIALGDRLTAEEILGYLDKESFLGGSKIEGVVLKNYSLFGRDSKILIAKYVSEKFKEIHGKDWKDRNPSGKDFIGLLISEYKTQARWAKAVQHLKESGCLEGSPRDIGNLIKEVKRDVKDECYEEITKKMWSHFGKTFQSGIVKGLAEWYKAKLLRENIDD